MNTQEYPYEKSVLLNAAYDVLERLDIPLTYADSKAGVLRFGDGCATEMELTAILRDGSEITRVELGNTGPELCGVLLDELCATLKKNFETRRGSV